MYTFFLIIHVLVVILLIIVIMVQRGRGGGLIEAFSPAESLFGTKTSSFLVKSTAVLAGAFLITSLILTSLSKKRSAPLTEKYKKILEEPAKQKLLPPVESKQKPVVPVAGIPEKAPAIPAVPTVAPEKIKGIPAVSDKPASSQINSPSVPVTPEKTTKENVSTTAPAQPSTK